MRGNKGGDYDIINFQIIKYCTAHQYIIHHNYCKNH